MVIGRSVVARIEPLLSSLLTPGVVHCSSGGEVKEGYMESLSVKRSGIWNLFLGISCSFRI